MDRFVRFVTGVSDPDDGTPLGVFAACYDLLRDEDTDETMAAELRAYLDWFKEHLDTPDSFTRHAFMGRGSSGEQGKALCWYRSSSQNFIRHMWTLVRILREHGITVTKITTDNPGYVAYEDEYQVVAIPVAGT